MTREEVKRFANLGDLPSLHAQLLGTLQQSTAEMARLINHHGTDLATLLQYHSKSSESDELKNGSSSDSSSSDSESSDSSDSEQE